MPAIHIRDVPESTVAALRERAAQNGRSMPQEVLAILEAVAAEPVPSQAQTTWRREDIYGDEGR